MLGRAPSRSPRLDLNHVWQVENPVVEVGRIDAAPHASGVHPGSCHRRMSRVAGSLTSFDEMPGNEVARSGSREPLRAAHAVSSGPSVLTAPAGQAWRAG